MKVRYVSDLHLEFAPLPPNLPSSPDEILLVAGDTMPVASLQLGLTGEFAERQQARYDEFIKWAKGFHKTFLIGGNHDPYHYNIHDWYNTLHDYLYVKHKLDPNKFILIENGCERLTDKTLLLASTLWTDMAKNNPVAHMNVGLGMNDFHVIRGFTTQDAYRKHQETLINFDAYLDVMKQPDVLVMTHHCPSYQSLIGGTHTSPIIDPGYASELSDWILKRDRIKWWVHGHTHHNVDYMIGDCNVLANQRGYGMANHHDYTFDIFSLDKYIEID